MDLVLYAWIVGACAIGYYLYNTRGLSKLVLEVGTNDEYVAAKYFTEFVNDAKEDFLIRDDGNDMSGSLYNNTEIVDAVTARLHENPKLRIRCLFYSKDDTLFTKTLCENPQVVIHRGGERHRVHFKIIDHGLKGYLSSHEYGESDRRYRMYDCSHVPARVRDATLGRHVRTMQDVFQGAQGEMVG